MVSAIESAESSYRQGQEEVMCTRQELYNVTDAGLSSIAKPQGDI